jgi:ABC-type polysaccharide/polyol phosphate export permease
MDDPIDNGCAAAPERLAAPRQDLARLARRAAGRARALVAPANRALFVELVRASFKVADHNSIAGALWSLIAPFAMLVALYLVFKNRFGEELAAYPLYLLIGISFVNYFATVTRFLIGVLPQNRSLMLDTTVPRETVILAQVAFHTYKLLVELLFCALLAAYYDRFTWGAMVAAVPLVTAFVALVTGVGLLGAVVHSFARDIEHIWSLVSRLLLFVTPVFYDLESLSPLARFVITWLNPLTPFLTALRGLLIGPVAPAGVYAHAMLVGTGFLVLGYGTYLLVESAALERT